MPPPHPLPATSLLAALDSDICLSTGNFSVDELLDTGLITLLAVN